MKAKNLREKKAKNKVNSNSWWFITAKDGSSIGYMSGQSKEEACENFGLEVEQCSVKRVIKTGKGFIEPDQFEQGKLL